MNCILCSPRCFSFYAKNKRKTANASTHHHRILRNCLSLLHCKHLTFKDPVLPIMHCALATIGGHFLDVESWCWYLKSVCIASATDITVLLGVGSSALIIKEHLCLYLLSILSKCWLLIRQSRM